MGIGKAVRALAALSLAAASGAALAQQEERVLVLEDAQFVLGDSPRPPGDDAAWRPVRLPDNWYFSHPGPAATGWYRMAFELPPGPPRVHALYMPRNSSRNFRYFVNGNLLSGNLGYGDPGARNWAPPALSSLPPLYVHPGRNVMHVRVEAIPALRQGLSRMSVGPAPAVRLVYEQRQLLQVTTLLMFGAAALLAGCIAAAFWWRERRDATLGWYAVTAFAWAGVAAPWAHGALAAPQFSYGWLAFITRFAYAAPMLVLCLRVAGRRWPWAERALWLFTLAGVALAQLASEDDQGVLITAWSFVYLAALVALLALLARSQVGERRWVLWMFALAIVLVVLLNAHDIARWMGWV